MCVYLVEAGVRGECLTCCLPSYLTCYLINRWLIEQPENGDTCRETWTLGDTSILLEFPTYLVSKWLYCVRSSQLWSKPAISSAEADIECSSLDSLWEARIAYPSACFKSQLHSISALWQCAPSKTTMLAQAISFLLSVWEIWVIF